MARVTQRKAIKTLEEAQAELEALLGRLSDEDLVRPATIGGGDWSAKDLMAHVARWNEIAVDALAEWREGKKPWIESEWTGGVDKVNADNYERSRDLSVAEAQARLRLSHKALVAAIGTIDNAEWHSAAPYPTERRQWLGVLLGGITGAPQRAFGHGFAHLPDLEAFASAVGQPG